MKKVVLGRDCFVAIALLAMTTWGCPDGDDDSDAACPLPCATGYVCLYGDCVPESGDADSDDTGGDADGDADTTETEDDATEDGTDEGTASCPSVTGTWNLTYHNDDGAEGHYTLTLEQDVCIVVGWDDDCDYSGSISASGYLSLYRDCNMYDRNVTGNFTQTPAHMGGRWDDDRDWHGDWWADPQ